MSRSLAFFFIFVCAGCAGIKHEEDFAAKGSHPEWAFRVETGVEAAGARQAVIAEKDAPGGALAWTIMSLQPDAGKVLVADRTATTTSLRIDMPAVERDTHVMTRVESVPPGDKALFVWTTLLRPRGARLMDYRGVDDLAPPADFDDYWARALRELEAVAPEPVVTRVSEHDTPTGLLHRVELRAVRDTKIVCWYYVPRAAFDDKGEIAKSFPAVLVMPGYGAEEPPIDRTAQGFITLSVNPRHHGPSKDFWKSPVEHMLYNITDPENYYYKLAYLDCVQAARFAFSRKEVDGARVAAEGGSQGGLFAIALAALEPRIACACSNVTAFSAMGDSMVLAQIGHGVTYREQLAKAAPRDAAIMRRSLALADGANLAARVRCPVQINMGGIDPVCNYVCGIVVFNQLPGETPKEYLIYPGAKHEVPQSMREANLRWYRQWMGE